MNQKTKLLIIDDEEVVLDSCTQILAGGDLQITTAPNGTIGLQLLREYLPDLVLVDLKMPGISGLEVLEGIRDFDPTIVSIVITGYATVGSAIEAMKKGAYDFLPKPFTPDELRLIAHRGLEKRRLILETIALRREKEMLREHFAAIVSHELKAPLGAVQQNLFVLADELSDKLTEEQKNRIGRIQSRIGDLVNLIHTWLRVMSVDTQKIQESFKPVSVEAVITKSVEDVQPHAIRKDIEVIASMEKPLRSVNGDEGTLAEAFTNIIGNAVKYSRPGSKVNVIAEPVEDEIIVSVIDSGVGISKEDLPFIFNDFYMGRSRPEGEQSSGLGLAITRRIVEAHQGMIFVESEFGKGSTFMIHLPVIKE